MSNKLTKAVSWTVQKTKQYPKIALWASALAVDWIANSFGITKTLWLATKWIIWWVKWSVDTILAAKSWWAMVWASAPLVLSWLWWYYWGKLADKMKIEWKKKLAIQALWLWAWLAVSSTSLAPAALVAWLAYPVWKWSIYALKKSKDVAKFWWKWAVEKPTKAMIWWVTPIIKAPFKAVAWVKNWLKGDGIKDLLKS